MTVAITPPMILEVPLRRGIAPLAPALTPILPETVHTLPDVDLQMMQAVKKGFVVRTPTVFAITAGLALAAGTTVGVAALIGGWAALLGGWYFGSLFFINGRRRDRRAAS